MLVYQEVILRSDDRGKAKPLGSRLPIQQLLEKAYEVYPPATINIY